MSGIEEITKSKISSLKPLAAMEDAGAIDVRFNGLAGPVCTLIARTSDLLLLILLSQAT